jgi:hypothetical protein
MSLVRIRPYVDFHPVASGRPFLGHPGPLDRRHGQSIEIRSRIVPSVIFFCDFLRRIPEEGLFFGLGHFS